MHGMLPVWVSPWHGWRFRLIRYTGILYLGYAVKPAEREARGVESRTGKMLHRRMRLESPNESAVTRPLSCGYRPCLVVRSNDG